MRHSEDVALSCLMTIFPDLTASDPREDAASVPGLRGAEHCRDPGLGIWPALPKGAEARGATSRRGGRLALSRG